MITPAGGRTTFVSPPQAFVSAGLAPAGSPGIPAPIVLIVIAAPIALGSVKHRLAIPVQPNARWLPRSDDRESGLRWEDA